MLFFKTRRAKGLRMACGCDIGKKRKNNEDNFYFNGLFLDSDNTGMRDIKTEELPFPWDWEDEDCFLAVFDGMGGGDYGEIASNTAAAEARNFLEDGNNINPSDITPSLTELCRRMNSEVFRSSANLGSYQMGSTVVSLFFHAGQVWVCNVGDSRCYCLREDGMEQISVDHTDEAEMAEQGITGRKPYLTQYLGADPEEMRIEPYIKSYPVKDGERFLLCSDGLTDMVGLQEICNVLSESDDPSGCVSRLIRMALEAGGRDNITVIVCFVE